MDFKHTESRQSLLDRAAQANVAEGIRQGLEDLANSEVSLAADVLDKLRAEHDTPR